MKVESDQEYLYSPRNPVCWPHFNGKRFTIFTKVEKRWRLWFKIRKLMLSGHEWKM